MADVPPIDLAREADFVLGGLEVRPRSRELVAGGKAEVLEPRIMQVLVALAQRRGRVVTRDELTWSCWGGRIVGEDAIYRCIHAIRQRAQAHGGFAVATVSRVGYRLDESALPFAKPALPTLAVLAFDNLSGDPGMAWFSDGVSVEILQTVTTSADLRVIGHGSSFQFRGADKAARKVGAVLGATHVLDGAVRRAGSRVRISAHLIECAFEVSLWSQTFERDLSDVFVLQDEIAAAVAAALRLAFAPTRTAETIDPTVYDLYLRSRDPLGGFAGSLDEQLHRRAIALLEEATARSPGFARAWADLAMRRAVCLRRFDPAHFPGLSRALATEAAQEALRLDPSLGVAHQALSYLAPFACYRDREALHERALAASPRDPEVLNLAGQFCAEVGRLSETLEYAGRAVALDPLYWPAAQWYAGLLDALGRHSETPPLWDDYLQRWPNVEALVGEALAGAASSGDWDRFEALVDASQRRGFDSPHLRSFVDYQRNRRVPSPDYLAAHRARMQAGLEGDGRVSLRDLVRLYALGRTDEAFDFAERASFADWFDPDGRPPTEIWAPGIMFLSSNRGMTEDPRFVRLCARLGLVDYWVATDRWPDCANPGVLAYDFKLECRQLATRSRYGVESP
jgi:adenylate cyclase